MKNQEDFDKEYIDYLKSFFYLMVIEKEEEDTLEFEEAINLNDISTDIIFMNDHFYKIGKLTKKGIEKIQPTFFDKILEKFLNF